MNSSASTPTPGKKKKIIIIIIINKNEKRREASDAICQIKLHIFRSQKTNYYQCLTDGVNRQMTSSAFSNTHTGHKHVPIHLPSLSERKRQVDGWLVGWRRWGMTIGRTIERDGKEMQWSIRGKYTKRKMQEGILNDRSETKYAHVLKSRPAVTIWHLFDICTVNEWTDAAEFPAFITLESLD